MSVEIGIGKWYDKTVIYPRTKDFLFVYLGEVVVKSDCSVEDKYEV